MQERARQRVTATLTVWPVGVAPAAANPHVRNVSIRPRSGATASTA